MNEILKMLNTLTADELANVLMRGEIILEKKRKEEAEAELREKERLRQEKIAEEKRRQEEIEELQRRLQELQSQKVVIPEEPGKTAEVNFVMYDAPRPVEQSQAKVPAQDEKVAQPQTVSCPHCNQVNEVGNVFCSVCGQRIPKEQPVSKPQPVPAQPKPEQVVCPHCNQVNEVGNVFCSVCGQRIPKEQPVSKPQPVPTQPKTGKVACPHCHYLDDAGSMFCSNCGKKMDAAAQPSVSASASRTVTQSQVSGAQVQYADESMDEWELLPGEAMERYKVLEKEVQIIEPQVDRKYTYNIQVTNKRILLSRQSAFAKGMRVAMGGLVGELITAAAGGGGKPWLAIPFEAISDCGIRNRNEFYIVADQTYVLKNRGFEKFLPELIANAKK